MALEVLLFRSLFRNTDVEMIDGRPVYGSASWLWFFGLVFHGSLLVIILRHLRFFTEPILPGIAGLTAVDGFLELAIPTLYLSDVMLLAAVIFLFVRRIINAPLRYISLAADYFALLLIAAIAVTGLWMRHIQPTDLEQVKALVMGWVTLSPHSPQGVGVVFFIHLFLICVLLAWFPFSKLMHAGGVFLSPTRNLANNSRSQRHMNPWNGPVLVHTYEEYEDEFRDKMKAAGLPVEKE
jgi:nitrate reductase gamma subunit